MASDLPDSSPSAFPVTQAPSGRPSPSSVAPFSRRVNTQSPSITGKWLLYRLKWLLPGLLIKRWLLLGVLGGSFLILGLALALNLQPITWTINMLRALATVLPSQYSGPALMLLGLLGLALAFRQTKATFQSVAGPNAWVSEFVEQLYRRNKLDRGPKIVAIGGGTGLSTLLRGLKRYTNNITAVVTVGDDGGSSGRLREEQGIIPPGDIRNCIAALADEEQLITELFQYRFKPAHKGDGQEETPSTLTGHSFGNLFLTAMCQVTGDMVSAIKESSKVLSIRGRVLPSTLDNVRLVAELADGSRVYGESAIPEARQRIARIWCEPAELQPLPEVLEAIAQADLILMGPGSLYTSVIPNLLIAPLAQAVANSHAPKVYVANMMTQPGETEGYSAADHVQAIVEHSGQPGLIDAVVANNRLPGSLVERYRQFDYEPVLLDRERLAALGVKALIEKPIVHWEASKTIRHDSVKLARAIIVWYKRDFLKGRGRFNLKSPSASSASSAPLPEATLAAVSDKSPSLESVLPVGHGVNH